MQMALPLLPGFCYRRRCLPSARRARGNIRSGPGLSCSYIPGPSPKTSAGRSAPRPAGGWDNRISACVHARCSPDRSAAYRFPRHPPDAIWSCCAGRMPYMSPDCTAQLQSVPRPFLPERPSCKIPADTDPVRFPDHFNVFLDLRPTPQRRRRTAHIEICFLYFRACDCVPPGTCGLQPHRLRGLRPLRGERPYSGDT
jgi:hypothetical protein